VGGVKQLGQPKTFTAGYASRSQLAPPAKRVTLKSKRRREDAARLQSGKGEKARSGVRAGQGSKAA
jgi:hypothetical protein